jgi:hypothetical protein
MKARKEKGRSMRAVFLFEEGGRRKQRVEGREQGGGKRKAGLRS